MFNYTTLLTLLHLDFTLCVAASSLDTRPMTTVPPQNAPSSVVLGTLLTGTEVAVRVHAEGCTTGDLIRKLEASTGQANVFWLMLWGSKLLARAADKYLEHPALIDEMPTEGLTFLKHQHKLSERAGLFFYRADGVTAQQNEEYHAVFLAASAKTRDVWWGAVDFGFWPRILGAPRWRCKEFALTAVQLHGQALQWFAGYWWNDDDVVLQAVRTDGTALEYASDSLRDNESIAMEAVRQNYEALRFASDRLRDSEAIFKQYPVRFASERVRLLLAEGSEEANQKRRRVD